MHMIEEWRQFECGNYEVSNFGVVRRRTPGRKTYPGRVLKSVLMGMGYYVVNPVICGKNFLMYVHHIVALHFMGETPGGCEINHIDGDKLNNRFDNLEFVSHLENMRHARSLGLISYRVRYPQSSIDLIRSMAADGMNARQVSEVVGISRRYCSDVINNRTRKVK